MRTGYNGRTVLRSIHDYQHRQFPTLESEAGWPSETQARCSFRSERIPSPRVRCRCVSTVLGKMVELSLFYRQIGI